MRKVERDGSWPEMQTGGWDGDEEKKRGRNHGDYDDMVKVDVCV